MSLTSINYLNKISLNELHNIVFELFDALQTTMHYYGNYSDYLFYNRHN